MKRKLIRRNKKYISSTMGKYEGYLSWQRVCDVNFDTLEDFLASLNKDKVQWRYMWLIKTKLLKEVGL